MIEISKIHRATIRVSIKIKREEEERLAEDIKNWLMTHKDMICDVEVK